MRPDENTLGGGDARKKRQERENENARKMGNGGGKTRQEMRGGDAYLKRKQSGENTNK